MAFLQSLGLAWVSGSIGSAWSLPVSPESKPPWAYLFTQASASSFDFTSTRHLTTGRGSLRQSARSDGSPLTSSGAICFMCAVAATHSSRLGALRSLAGTSEVLSVPPSRGTVTTLSPLAVFLSQAKRGRRLAPQASTIAPRKLPDFTCVD